KRVLVVKVVKPALWNYFKNRQGLITKNTYRQLATWHKFFYQQFAIVLTGLRHRRIKFARVFNNHHANGSDLSRRLYHQRDRHRRLLRLTSEALWKRRDQSPTTHRAQIQGRPLTLQFFSVNFDLLPSSARFSHDLHFGFQFDSALSPRSRLDLFD